jgi:hypothetical protein
MSVRITILPVLLSTNLILSQDLPMKSFEPTAIAEELFAQQELDLNYEELYETILQYLASPLDINRATAEELRSLFLLNDLQINDLIAYRNLNGNLLSIYELQAIGSFDADLIRRLAPFVRVQSSGSSHNLIRRIVSESNNYFILRYERMLEMKDVLEAGQDSLHRFVGSPDKYFIRFRVSHPKDFSVGFTLEKDPGESHIADYLSFHFQRCGKRIVNFIAGDFQSHFGQGLVMGGGFGMGKGAEAVLTMRRNTLGFIPWTSSGETGFFRGVGTTVAVTKNIMVHAFISRKFQDARLADVGPDQPTASLQTSGLHQTVSDLAYRKTVREDNAGVAVEFRNRNLQAGLTSLNTRWNIPLATGTTIYDRLEPAGRNSLNLGAFVNYTIRNFNVFGEAAQSISWGAGMVAGTLVSVNRKLDLAFLARRYAPDFWSPYGSAISENSTARNESAIYWGWKIQVSRSLTFAGYTDLFHFGWLRYRSYAVASTGHDALVRMTWKPRREVKVIVQAREERKARNAPLEDIYRTTIGIKRNYCIAMDYSPGTISFRTRVQGSTLKLKARSRGMAISQDIGWDGRYVGIHLRHAFFDTDDFDNRQYVYEPDMWMAYSFPAYYGVGVRTTAMARLKLGPHADIWIRWARSRYEDRSATVPGTSALEGPVRNDVKVQLRIKL